MDHETLKQHKFQNTLQTFLMLAGIALILAFVGWSFGGPGLMVGMLLAGVLMLIVSPQISPKAVLKMYKAQPLDYSTAPGLARVMDALASRAELPHVPKLYYIPSQLMNAFAVGTGKQASVAVTDGLLRRLDNPETVAVLAHEVSHIRNNDVRVMGMADMLSRMTHSFSVIGQVMLFVNLPLILMGRETVSWWAIAVLIFAPQISALLQLGLSRVREFDADRSAAELTGDPRSLALALKKLEQQGGRWFEQVFMPNRKNTEPSLLRTHPPTQERIRRLLAMEGKMGGMQAKVQEPISLSDWLAAMGRPSRPRHHLLRGLRF